MKFLKKMLSKYRESSVLVKASFWFVMCSTLQKGLTAITTPIFTRLMTTQEYGDFNVFFSWESILSEIVTLQLFFGVYLQGLVKFENERNVFISSLQGLSLVLVLFWTIIYALFHSFWNALFDLTTVQMLAMLAMIWASSAYSFWAGEQRMLYRYKRLVALTLIVSFLRPTLSVLAVISAEDKVTARILAIAFVNVIAYSILFIINMRKGKVFFSAKFWKYAICFNLPLLPHFLSVHILHSADKIMIKQIVGASAAGVYGLAYSVSLIVQFFNGALNSAITPYIYQKIKSKKIQELSKVAYVSLPVIALVNLALMLFAPEVVAIFAPKEYYEAIWVIPPVSMGVYFLFMYGLYFKFAMYYEKTFFVMGASLLGALANIALNALLIPKFGYIAAGYTTLLGYMIYTGAHYGCMRYICKRHFEGVQPYEMKKIFAITASFMGIGFLILFTYRWSTLRYTLVAISLLLAIWKRNFIVERIREFSELKKQGKKKTPPKEKEEKGEKEEKEK